MIKLFNNLILQTLAQPKTDKFEVVLGVVGIIFIGLVAYLISLDRKIKKLENK